jgi:mRNA-degrading endonuclease RelE of RelBE toxin-antitoxin system
MNKFQVSLTEHAANDLKDISKEIRNQVLQDLKALEISPFPSGTHIKRLKGFRPPLCRLRSGDFRILFYIQGDMVTMLRVIDRKLLERVLKRLKILPRR